MAFTAAVVGLLIGLVASPAWGHAELIRTNIESGSVLTEPVEQIELEFSDVVTPVSLRLVEGRSALGGSVIQPTTSSVIVRPGEPLRSGQYALVWRVKTLDQHVVEGSISFRVAIPGEAAAEAPPATVVAAAPSTPEPTLVTTTTLPLVNTRLPAAAYVVHSQPAADPTTGEWVGRVGRWGGMTGALLAIGALAFAGTALVGKREEVESSVRWVRRGGVLVLVGAVLEVIGVSAMQSDSLLGALAPTSLAEVLGGTFGLVVLLRLIGGAALLQDPRLASMTEVQQPPPMPHGDGSVATMPQVEPQYRLALGQEWVAIAGVTAVALSFALDGHSASTDPAVLVRTASFVHVLAGGVWFGGLVAMLGVINDRRAQGRGWDVAALSVRFSRVATVALVLVALAGGALASTILGDPSELIDTGWGRLLLIKTGLVGLAAGIGAYNHFVVVPGMDAGTRDGQTLQRTVQVEVVLLSVVLVATAVLVGLAV